jgi:hypothetical protein
VDIVGVVLLQMIQRLTHLMGMVIGQFPAIGSPLSPPPAFWGRGILEIGRVFVRRVEIPNHAEEQSLLGFDEIPVLRLAFPRPRYFYHHSPWTMIR